MPNMRINAKQSGLWNDPNTWITNTVPTLEDEVFCNTYDIIVDTDIQVGSISNRQTYDRVYGGRILIQSNNLRIMAALICSYNSLIDFNGENLNLIGSIYGSDINGEFGCINNSGAGNINIEGDVYGGNSYNSYGVYNKGGGTVNINGNLVQGNGAFSFAVFNENGIVKTNEITYPYQGGL